MFCTNYVQATFWLKADLLSIGHWGANNSSAKRRPFCFCVNVLIFRGRLMKCLRSLKNMKGTGQNYDLPVLTSKQKRDKIPTCIRWAFYLRTHYWIIRETDVVIETVLFIRWWSNEIFSIVLDAPIIIHDNNLVFIIKCHRLYKTREKFNITYKMCKRSSGILVMGKCVVNLTA